MKKNIILFLALFVFFAISLKAQTQFVSYGNYTRCEEYFLNTNISPLLANKTWQMNQMYADQVPVNDSIPKSFRFVFAFDSLQPTTSQILTVLRKVGVNESGVEFKYTINDVANTISLFHGETGVLQKTFTVTCLTPGHLALTFTENGKDASGNPKVFNMEYRFLVDYTWEYSQPH